MTLCFLSLALCFFIIFSALRYSTKNPINNSIRTNKGNTKKDQDSICWIWIKLIKIYTRRKYGSEIIYSIYRHFEGGYFTISGLLVNFIEFWGQNPEILVDFSITWAHYPHIIILVYIGKSIGGNKKRWKTPESYRLLKYLEFFLIFPPKYRSADGILKYQVYNRTLLSGDLNYGRCIWSDKLNLILCVYDRFLLELQHVYFSGKNHCYVDIFWYSVLVSHIW